MSTFTLTEAREKLKELRLWKVEPRWGRLNQLAKDQYHLLDTNLSACIDALIDAARCLARLAEREIVEVKNASFRHNGVEMMLYIEVKWFSSDASVSIEDTWEPYATARCARLFHQWYTHTPADHWIRQPGAVSSIELQFEGEEEFALPSGASAVRSLGAPLLLRGVEQLEDAATLGAGDADSPQLGE